jgi:RimJ/RimL family protein N-acetyltransferase
MREDGMGERGWPVGDWSAPPRPGPAVLEGRHARLERLAPGHAAGLWEAYAADPEGRLWDYMPYGPFAGAADYAAWVAGAAAGADPWFYAVIDRESGRPGGVASLMRITPEHGVIEVGSIAYAPRLQRTRAATEAMTLLAGWAFGAGYRRYEWKCDALNAPSRRAAQRLGFSYEGTFRQHMVIKGRNRDTAWFAMTDRDWPGIAAAHEAWLDPGNFDAEGRQRRRLGELTAPHRVASDPGHSGG